MSRVNRTIQLLVSVFSLLITVLLLPSLKFMSHAWSPIVTQKTAKQTFGEVPVTGNVFYSLSFPLASSASVESTSTHANAIVLTNMEMNSGRVFGSLRG